jgi:transposase-like protein
MDTERDGSTADQVDPGLGVDAVARRFGIAPATLRSWHRRYGIGPSGHSVGSRRYYLPEDLARLELMRRAVTRGTPVAEAARWALAQTSATAVRPAGDKDAAARPSFGGRGLRLVGAVPRARGLSRAVLAMDAAATRAVLAESLDDHGVVRTWDELARPVLNAIAAQWEATGEGVEIEHLLSECLVRELDRAVAAAGAPRNARPVLLACAPHESHALPLCALAAALAERRIVAHQLGARLPWVALDAAVTRTAPPAVLLWAQAPLPPGDPFPARPRTRRPEWFTGGPGWDASTVPAGSRHLGSLAAATEALAAAAVGGVAPGQNPKTPRRSR